MSRPADNILGTLPVPKLVWTMSSPIMLSMLMSAIYNLVDSIYVAQVSELDFLALSYAYPVQLMMVAFCAGTGVGFNALFAQRLGAGQKEEANRVACHGFLFYGLCWLLFLAFALLGTPLFFRLSTGDGAVAAAGTSYLVICCGLSIGMCMQFLTERLLQTTGHPAGFMVVQGSGAILNIVLDPVFIFGLDMGVVGAAVATVIGQFCGAGMTLYFNLNKNPDIQISFRGFRPSAKAIGRIYTVGLPSIAMQCVGSVMTFFMNQILMAFSATAVAVFGVYFKLQSFVFMPIFGMNNGMVPIISYNYGARKPERVKKTIRLAVFYAECIMLVGFCIFQFLPDKLLGLFAASDAMLAIGVPALRIICPHFLLAGAGIVLSSVFQALGNGVFSLTVSICRQLVVLIPAAWLLSRTGEVNMVWWAFIIAEVVSLALSLVFMARINRTVIVPLSEKQDAAV